MLPLTPITPTCAGLDADTTADEPFRVVARDPLDAAAPLLAAIARLHDESDAARIERAVVDGVERIVGGAVAAVFRTASDQSFVALCATGPAWRSAERDAPAWLAPLTGSLADLVRADVSADGAVLRGAPLAGGADVAHLPLGVDGDGRRSLVVLWTPPTRARLVDHRVLSCLATHAALALRRARSAAERRTADSIVREAESEIVRQHGHEVARAMAGGAAHDLNNALAVLVGLSECLLASPDLDPAMREDLVEMQHSIDGLTRMAERFAFIGRQPGRPEGDTVDVGRVFEECVQEVRRTRDPALDAHPFEIEPSPSIHTVANAADLHALLLAFVRTLTQWGPAHARIEADAARIVVTVDVMAPADAEPFSVLYTREARWRRPTLATCRRIAAAHGWSLSSTTAPDRLRQSFQLILPAR